MTNMLFAKGPAVRCCLRLLCLLIVIFFCRPTRVISAETDGVGMSQQDPCQILRYALEMNRANYDKLKTWTTKIRYTQNISGGQFERFFRNRRIEGLVDFAVDMETDSFRWNLSRSLTRKDTNSGVSEDTRRHFTAGLAVEDRFYNFGPEGTERTDRKRTYALWDRRDRSFGTDDFRPHLRCFFGQTIGFTGIFYDHLESYVKWISEGTFDGSIRIDGDLVILRTRPDAEPYLGNEYVLDLSKGGNLVRWYASAGPGDVGEDLIDYAEHNGVWVPVSYKRRTIRGDLYIEELEYVFESHKVNVPLSPDEFTLAGIEGRPGDEIYDNRTGMRYVYEPGASLAKEARNVEPAIVDFPDDIALDDEAADSTKPPVKVTSPPETTAMTPAEVRDPSRRTWIAVTVIVLLLAVVAVALVAVVAIVTRRRK